MKMQRQQYKRFYNIAYVLFVVCSFYFVFGFTKSFVESNFVDAQKVKRSLMFDKQSQIIFDKLVEAGKREQAEQLIHDPAQIAFAVYLSEDESGQPYLKKFNAIDDRVKFCEQNLNVISVIGALVVFVLAYFLIWQIVSFSARYVRGHPDQASVNSNK